MFSRPLPQHASRFGAALRVAAGLAICLTLAAPSAAQTQADPEAASGLIEKPLVEAERYMIVAAHPLAAAAGAQILAEGGSAVDAAIAAQMVLTLVEPQSSGIGGGAFALYWEPTKPAADGSPPHPAAGGLTSWDGRETAPMAATPDMFMIDDAPMPWLVAAGGGRSIGAPGLVRMLGDMHARYGRLPWARLFDDAIRLSTEGFEVSPRLAASLERFGARLVADPVAAALFFRDGRPLRAGERLTNPVLAATFRRLATEGPDAFYSGKIAEAVVAAAGREPHSGTLSLDDLAAYRAVERAPLCVAYWPPYEVCGMGPPSSGGATVAQILKILQVFPLRELGSDHVGSRHYFAEASRLAYADRDLYLADADFVPAPLQGMLQDPYLFLRAQQIGPTASEAPATAGAPLWRDDGLQLAPDQSFERPGTTHISIADSHGAVLSMTSSIETAFGSGRMAAGFLLNNQLTDFSFRPVVDGRTVANAVEPGKRPRSSMAPTIVLSRDADGVSRPAFALGSPGGSRIIEYVALSVLALIDWGLTPPEAAALPHVSHRNRGDTVVEHGPLGDALAFGLQERGHRVSRAHMTSGLHIIEIGVDGRLYGGADPRREGVALGR